MAQTHGSLYIALSRLYEHREKWAEAEEAYRQGISAARTHSPLYIALGQLYEHREKWAEAEEAYRQGIDAAPPQEIYVALGQLYERQEKWAEAEEVYKKATKMMQNSGLSYYRLVRVLLARGDFAAAQRFAEAAMARTQRDAHAYRALAEVHLRTSNFLEARAICRRGLQDCGKVHALYALIAEAFMQEGDIAGAVEFCCEEWERLMPPDGNSYTVHVTCLLKKGDTDGARQVVQRGLTDVPEWPPLLELAKQLDVEVQKP